MRKIVALALVLCMAVVALGGSQLPGNPSPPLKVDFTDGGTPAIAYFVVDSGPPATLTTTGTVSKVFTWNIEWGNYVAADGEIWSFTLQNGYWQGTFQGNPPPGTMGPVPPRSGPVSTAN